MNQKENITDLERQLTQLLGKKTYTYGKRACTGKYRGLYDYSLIFDDGSKICISCGRKRYQTELEDMVREYQYFHDNRRSLETLTKEVVERDNRQALELGLIPLEFIKLDLIKDSSDPHVFWVAAYFERNGIQFKHMETNFFHACVGFRTDEHFKKMISRPDEWLGRLKEFLEDGAENKSKYNAILFGYLCQTDN